MSTALAASLPGPAPCDLVRHCRVCGGEAFAQVLDLGTSPLANDLLPTAAGPAPARYPLQVLRCRRCSLVQLAHIVSPVRLFTDYSYFSSYSETMLHHAAQLVARLVATEKLGAESLVVEIASNDGYLLQHVQRAGVQALGIEPAGNIARVARQRGIDTVERFFGRALAEELARRGQLARVIIGINVLAHVPDLTDFMQGVRTLLGPDGCAVFEFPYLKDLLDRCEFDTIYHEHQSYFSLHAVISLSSANGLSVVDVERLDIHGGSLRVTLAQEGARRPSPAVVGLLEEECGWGVKEDTPYAAFAQRVSQLRAALNACVRSIEEGGATIAAYGAAAKGVTLLSYCGLGRREIDFVVDRNPHKQGHFYPVERIPILPVEALEERRPDYALLLTWNFAAEIMEQQKSYLDAGGQFILPVPEPRVVGK